MTVRTDAIAPRVSAADRIGQGTAVEQSRAVAEVEAQVVMAKRFPRNEPAAITAMRETCQRRELAERAFFRYPKAGKPVSGPSIQLARELARIWGNISYGSAELRRDDEFGQSEMLAYAWDIQTNTRNSAVIINPHRQYTGGGDLTELRDIQENNASVVNRRVREAIWAVLPPWLVEEAKDLCAKTIADGGGIPLPQRIANAIEVFGNLGVTTPQLEAKIGTPSPKWTDHDVAQLRVIRQSLLRGEISKEEEFPPERASAAEVLASAHAIAPADRFYRGEPAPGAGEAGGGGEPDDGAPGHNHADGIACPPDCPYRQGVVQSAIDHNMALLSEQPKADPCTTGQQGMIAAQFKRLGFGEGDGAEMLKAASVLAGRPDWITAIPALTAAEATTVRDGLKSCKDRGELIALLAEVSHQAEADGEQGQ